MVYILSNQDFKQKLLDRFIKYVKIFTESNSKKADDGVMPSNPNEKELANLLKAELSVMGLQQVTLTEDCYVYAYLSASKGFEKTPSICLISHIDTAEDVSGLNVNPIIHPSYDGSLIDLNCGVCHDVKKDSALAKAAENGETIITSDGTTLLGADDKAGVAEIMTCFEYLVSHPEIKHGKVEVLFSPDEETGHGMDKVPLNLIKSHFACTVDGGNIGELETECFNAYSAKITFTGKSTHTGSAKAEGFINAINIASLFIQSIPVSERPETTSQKEGFFAVTEIIGHIEKTTISMLLRDFSDEGMQKRISTVKTLAQSAALSFGGKVEFTFKEQYKNMKTEIEKNPLIVDALVNAYKKTGIEPIFVPIRGGTDGSRLTEMKIPTPNIFTGGHNFHSRNEWASLEQMQSATDVLINLIKEITEKE